MHSMPLSGGVTAHFNGDFSGKIKLAFYGKAEHSHRAYILDENNGFPYKDPMEDYVQVELTFDDIRKLYLERVRNEKIHRIEQMTDAQLEERLIEGC